MTLKAKNLYKSYGKIEILKGVNLSLSAGETVAILGKSGEGKTTLLHMLAFLETPDAGQIEIGGRLLTPKNAPEIRKKYVSFIFQSYNLLEDFTALENVLMPDLIARKAFDSKKGASLLRQVGLEDKARSLAKNLSGGERQRVAIARALCSDPSILFADEPTGNLDRENRDQITLLLKSLKKSLILVTHDTGIAKLCDRRLLLEGGQLFELG